MGSQNTYDQTKLISVTILFPLRKTWFRAEDHFLNAVVVTLDHKLNAVSFVIFSPAPNVFIYFV